MTSDSSQFTRSRLYHRLGTVIVGIGRSIPISHISEYVIATNSDTLLLNDLLYVPNIHKNLLYVSKFAKDNHVFF